MPARRVPTSVKKAKGTFNVTDDRDKDFRIIDGLVKFTPDPPNNYDSERISLWNKVWRHMIKHGYGKEADYELVHTYVREYFLYIELTNVMDYVNGYKALSAMMKASEQLGLNPAAMAKVAVLAKPKKTGLKELLKDGTND